MGTYREARLGAARTHLARGLAGASLLALGIASTGAGATTLNYDGMIQTYSVLDTGIYDITAAGAKAGIGGPPGGIGGRGAVGGGDISLDAGTTLYVVVGGRGGEWNWLWGRRRGRHERRLYLTGGNATPLLVSGGGGGGGGGPGVVTAGQSAEAAVPLVTVRAGAATTTAVAVAASEGRPITPPARVTAAAGYRPARKAGTGMPILPAVSAGSAVPGNWWRLAGLAAAAAAAITGGGGGGGYSGGCGGDFGGGAAGSPISHPLSSMSRRSTH